MIWDKIFKDWPIDSIYGLYLKDGWIKKPTFGFKKFPISKDLPNYVYRLWKWANQNSKGELAPTLPREFPNEFKLQEESK